MQLVEVDDILGLRAAIITCVSDASSLRFVLVPISPLGEPAHYEALREKLRSCDLVVTSEPGPSQRGIAKLRDLEWTPQWERIGRGRHVRLSTLDAWDGVDRPFITPPAVPTNGAASRGGPRPRHPIWVVLVEPFRPLMAMVVSRYVTRVLVGDMLAAHARQALGPNPSGLGALDAYCRYCAEQLTDVVRQLHSERHGQTLRVAVADLIGVLPRVARALGGLSYSPDEVDWMTVFPWLPGDNPSEGPRPWLERVFADLYRAP
jgi:hypothetical protein